MRCSSCGFTDFRILKKCPSCNAFMKAKSSSAVEPSLVIFGSGGMDVADEEHGLDTEGFDEGGLDDVLEVPPVDDFGSGEPEDFALDLEEAQSGPDEPAQAEVTEDTMDLEPAAEEVAVTSIVPEEPEAEVDMQFDIGDTEPAADDAAADDMGFDFETDAAEIDGDADIFEGSMDEISLNDSAADAVSLDAPTDEISMGDGADEISMDDGAGEISMDSGIDLDAEPAMDLETDSAVELDPGISLDDATEESLDLDLDLDTEEPTPKN